MTIWWRQILTLLKIIGGPPITRPSRASDIWSRDRARGICAPPRAWYVHRWKFVETVATMPERSEFAAAARLKHTTDVADDMSREVLRLVPIGESIDALAKCLQQQIDALRREIVAGIGAAADGWNAGRRAQNDE
jgi:hypothetical protein